MMDWDAFKSGFCVETFPPDVTQTLVGNPASPAFKLYTGCHPGDEVYAHLWWVCQRCVFAFRSETSCISVTRSQKKKKEACQQQVYTVWTHPICLMVAMWSLIALFPFKHKRSPTAGEAESSWQFFLIQESFTFPQQLFEKDVCFHKSGRNCKKKKKS